MNHAVDLVLRAVMAPVLAVQAVRVRRHALILPEAGGPRSGVVGVGQDLRLLIVGDSSAAGVGVAVQDLALAGHVSRTLAASFRVDWLLQAQTGATTAVTFKRLQALPAQKFDVVIVALGVNDVTGMVPLELWLTRQRRLVRLLQDRFGARLICLSGLPPMGHFPLLPQPLRWVLGRQAARFDRHLRQSAAGDPALAYVPLDFAMSPDQIATDGYHPGPEIYGEWARVLRQAIIARLG